MSNADHLVEPDAIGGGSVLLLCCESVQFTNIKTLIQYKDAVIPV